MVEGREHRSEFVFEVSLLLLESVSVASYFIVFLFCAQSFVLIVAEMKRCHVILLVCFLFLIVCLNA